MLRRWREGSQAKDTGARERLERRGMDSDLDPPEGISPDDTLILRLLTCRTVREYICDSSHRKLIHMVTLRGCSGEDGDDCVLTESFPSIGLA